MTFNRRESAEWAQGTEAEVEKLMTGVDKALADGAARGFPLPPGDTLAAILAMGQDTKGKLVEVDGKIYDIRRGVLFQEQEFVLNILVKVAKLAMEIYREQIFDALAIEEEKVKALRETTRADVDRRNAETELRQRAIIQNRAEAERRVIVLKQQLVAEETATLTAETILVQAQLATAEKKLEIIASIYQVLAAEQLVLVAERHRAASLSKVLEAELIVAGIKKEMVPFYIQKAQAREALAQAIIQEIPITEALIRLGYDRIDLKTTEEYVGHLEREQQEDLELAREAYTRASTVLEYAKAQSRRLLLEYRNTIQKQIMDKKMSLEEDGITFKLATSLERMGITVNNEIAVSDHEVTNLTAELAAIIGGLTNRGNSEASKVLASASQISKISTTTLLSRKIQEGFF